MAGDEILAGPLAGARIGDEDVLVAAGARWSSRGHGHTYWNARAEPAR